MAVVGHPIQPKVEALTIKRSTPNSDTNPYFSLPSYLAFLPQQRDKLHFCASLALPSLASPL